MIVSYISDFFNNLYISENIINHMNSVSNSTNANANTTTTQIVHRNEGRASCIKSIFIYGTGTIRYHLVRTGTPLQKSFVIASTIVADAASTALKNAITDPLYIEKY